MTYEKMHFKIFLNELFIKIGFIFYFLYIFLKISESKPTFLYKRKKEKKV